MRATLPIAVLASALGCLVGVGGHPYMVACSDPIALGRNYMDGGGTSKAPRTAVARFDGFGCSSAQPVGGEYAPGDVLTVRVTGITGCALLELTGGATFRRGTCSQKRYSIPGIRGEKLLEAMAPATWTGDTIGVRAVYGSGRWEPTYLTTECQLRAGPAPVSSQLAPPPPVPPPPPPPSLFAHAPIANLSAAPGAPLMPPVVLHTVGGSLTLNLSLGMVRYLGPSGLAALTYGFNGCLTRGPVIRAKPGDKVTIRLTNDLPAHPKTRRRLERGEGGNGPAIATEAGDNVTVGLRNFLTMSGEAEPQPLQSGVGLYEKEIDRLSDTFPSLLLSDRRRLQHGQCLARDLSSTTLHGHGIHTSPRADDVFTPVPAGATHEYTYQIPEGHQGGTHWYHPHLHGVTALQLGGGAAGVFIVEEHIGQLPPAIAAAPELPVLMILHLDLKRLEALAEAMALECLSACSAETRILCEPEIWAPRIEQGVWPPSGIILVNGQIRPKLSLAAGVWHRLRLVFTSVSAVLLPVLPTCEVQLLSKDGVLLPLAPRPIQGGVVPPGGRADLLIRCPVGTHTLRSGPENTVGVWTAAPAWPEGPTAIHEDLLTLVAEPTPQQGQQQQTPAPASEGARSSVEPLPRFIAQRPCYVVDLWPSNGHNYSTHGLAIRLGPGSDGRMINGGKYSGGGHASTEMGGDGVAGPASGAGAGAVVGSGASAADDSSIGGGSPAAHVGGESFSWAVGSVIELALAGVNAHPLHTHVNPFQLPPASHGGPAVLAGTNNGPSGAGTAGGSGTAGGAWTGYSWAGYSWAGYFHPGDWHDTLLAPWVTADQPVNVRFQTDTFRGPQLIHCHNLDHSDDGQMMVVPLTGEEGATWRGARGVDPVCARALSDVGSPALISISDVSGYSGEAYPRRFPTENSRWRLGFMLLEYAAWVAAAVVLSLLLGAVVNRLAVDGTDRRALAPRGRMPRPIRRRVMGGLWPRRAEAVLFSHKVEMKHSPATSESGLSAD